jgi:hypothetical protein
VTQENFYDFWLSGVAALSILAVVTWNLRIGGTNPRAEAAAVQPVGFWTQAIAVLVPVALLTPAALLHADWTFTDYEIFTNNYLKGVPYPPPILTDLGRFLPLGHQEWRLLYLWTDNILVYHLFSVLQYAVFLTGCLTALRLFGLFKFPLFIFLVTLSPVIISFGNIVLPERTQVMIFPWILVVVLKWDMTARVRYLVLAVLLCHVMLYYKEPTVIFVGVFAGLRLLTQFFDGLKIGAGQPRWVGRALLAPSLLDMALVVYCLGYLLAFFSTIPPTLLVSDAAYHGHGFDLGSLGTTLSGWLARDPLLIVLLLLGFAGLLDRVARRRRLDTLDCLYFAGLAYAAALIATGLVSKYYAALPMTAVAIYVGGAAGLWAERVGNAAIRMAVGGVLVGFTLVNLFVAVPSFFYRYDWTTMNREFVDFVSALPPAPENRSVFTEGRYAWDVFVLEAYANGHRNAEICFPEFHGRAKYRCDGGADQVPGPERLTLEFYQGQHDRSATLRRGDGVIWGYDGKLFHSFLTKVPQALHPLLAPHYNIW